MGNSDHGTLYMCTASIVPSFPHYPHVFGLAGADAQPRTVVQRASFLEPQFLEFIS